MYLFTAWLLLEICNRKNFFKVKKNFAKNVFSNKAILEFDNSIREVDIASFRSGVYVYLNQIVLRRSRSPRATDNRKLARNLSFGACSNAASAAKRSVRRPTWAAAKCVGYVRNRRHYTLSNCLTRKLCFNCCKLMFMVENDIFFIVDWHCKTILSINRTVSSFLSHSLFQLFYKFCLIMAEPSLQY